MDTLKGLLKSKVFYFNLLTGMMELTSILTGVLPAGTLTAINVLGNIGLRFLTNTSLEIKGK